MPPVDRPPFPPAFRPRLVPGWVVLLVLAVAGWPAEGADTSWTHYRGTLQDGVYRGSLRTNWNTQTPRRLWRVAADPALSSFTYQDGRVFTQARRAGTAGEREYAIALNAATGQELWATDLDVADYPNGGVGDDDGPRSTPVVEGDRVYVFSTYLRLHCLEAATGRLVWRRDFRTELGASVVEWQNAASPVIVGDLILVNGNARPNRLMAIRKSDGTTAWRRHDEQMTQASPIHAVVAGVPQVIFFTEPNLVSVSPTTGDLLWRFPFRFSTSTAASPVVAGDAVYCSAAYGVGAAVVRVRASAGGTGLTISTAWDKRNANMNHWSTPVFHGAHFYGIYGQSSLSLRCIAAETGTETWRASSVGSHSVGYGSVLLVDHRLLVTTESGWVTLVEPDPGALRPLQSFEALTEGKCWNSPAIANGILYVRSTTQMAAYDLSPPAPPPALTLSPAVQLTDGTARLTVRSVDGTAIPGGRASGLTLQATEDPALPAASWKTLSSQASIVGGNAVLEDPTAGSTTRRYYRTRE